MIIYAVLCCYTSVLLLKCSTCCTTAHFLPRVHTVRPRFHRPGAIKTYHDGTRMRKFQWKMDESLASTMFGQTTIFHYFPLLVLIVRRAKLFWLISLYTNRESQPNMAKTCDGFLSKKIKTCSNMAICVLWGLLNPSLDLHLT